MEETEIEKNVTLQIAATDLEMISKWKKDDTTTKNVKLTS